MKFKKILIALGIISAVLLTTGAVFASYIPSGASSQVYTTKVTLSSAQILALNSSPIILVGAPGSGKIIQPISISTRLRFNTTAYIVAGVVEIKNPTGTNLVTPNTGLLTATTTKIYSTTPLAGELISNEGLQISATVASPTTGDSALDVYVTYQITTL